MYTPYFTITPEITRDIEAIGAVFGYFQAVKLPENYKKELISKITAESVHASTAIEGNTLTQKQVEDVLKGKKIVAEGEDIQEVINYNNALDYIAKLAEDKTVLINEKLIREINALVLRNISTNAGAYRTGQVIVGDYLPPEHRAIPSLMHEFVQWLAYPQPLHLSLILYAGIAHYALVAIHPFEDGNGRTTRVLTALLLMQHGYDMTRFFALESYYNRDRKAYYQALNSADQYRVEGKPNLTQWLEYYVEGMLIEAERAKSRIEELVEKNAVLSKKTWLSDMQRMLLEYTLEKQTAKLADYMTASHLSRKGTYNAIEKLVQEGLLERKGVGKSTYYIITEKGLEYTR